MTKFFDWKMPFLTHFEHFSSQKSVFMQKNWQLFDRNKYFGTVFVLVIVVWNSPKRLLVAAIELNRLEDARIGILEKGLSGPGEDPSVLSPIQPKSKVISIRLPALSEQDFAGSFFVLWLSATWILLNPEALWVVYSLVQEEISLLYCKFSKTNL